MAAVMAPFSEALGALVLIPLNIHDHKVAKEWIKELIEEVIAPSSERSIKRHVESVLGWNRSDSTESRIRDVPDQLRQEVQLTPTAVRRFLFPSFLMAKGLGSSENGEIPEVSVQKIYRRKEQAREEIRAGEAHSETPSNLEPGTRSENPPNPWLGLPRKNPLDPEVGLHNKPSRPWPRNRAKSSLIRSRGQQEERSDQ